MKKGILFSVVFSAVCCVLLLMAACTKTADQASTGGSGLRAMESPTQEKLGGTYWKAVEFRTDMLSADGLRTELFLWKDGTGRFVLRPLDPESFAVSIFGEDIMFDWAFKNGKLILSWQYGDLYTGAFEDGRLVLQYTSTMIGETFPVVMAQAAMPPYGARWNEVYRLYTAELLAAQEYSGAVAANWDNFDPDSRYPALLSGAQLADLNFDGIPELFLFDPGASASQGVHILTISNGSVQMIFRGDANMGMIDLYRKKSGGSLAYSFISANGDFDSYEGVYYLTDANTKMDKTFTDSAKLAGFSCFDQYDNAFEYLGSTYTVNGREVSEEVYKRLEEDLYKDYEKISRRPVTMEWEWESDDDYGRYLIYCDEWEISWFLNSYQPESGN